MDQLIEALVHMNKKCRDQKIDIYLELIKIHINTCDACKLSEGVRKLPW